MAVTSTWTAPLDWDFDRLVNESDMDTYVSSNLLYLYNNLPVTLLTTRGDLLTRDATGLVRLGIGASGRYLRSNGTDPSWATLLASDLTYSGLTAGQYLRASGATAAAFAALQFTDLTYSGLTTGNVLKATSATAASFSALAASDIASGQLALARGGTNADLSATGGSGQVLKQTSAGGAVSVAALTRTDLPSGIGCRAYNSANISIGNASTTFITLNSERYDTDNIHSTSVNTGRLTVPYAGKWLITCAVSFAANGTGTRGIQIWVNSGTCIATTFVAAAPGGVLTTDITAATIYTLSANDYLELGVYQNSGGALNLMSSSAYSPEFACHWLGA